MTTNTPTKIPTSKDLLFAIDKRLTDAEAAIDALELKLISAVEVTQAAMMVMPVPVVPAKKKRWKK